MLIFVHWKKIIVFNCKLTSRKPANLKNYLERECEEHYVFQRRASKNSTHVRGRCSATVDPPRASIERRRGGVALESKFDPPRNLRPCCASLVFLRSIPFSASFPAEPSRAERRQSRSVTRSDSCARAHLSSRCIMQPRMLRGEHTPYYATGKPPRVRGGACNT